MKSEANDSTESMQERIHALERRVLELEQLLATATATEGVLRQLAEHSGEVFWLTDLREGKVRYVSPSFERVYGVPVASVLDDPAAFLCVVHPDDRQAVAAQIQAQRQGRATRQEYRVVHPDGSVHWLLDRCTPLLDDDGTVQRLAGIVVEITERKAAEEEALQQKSLLRTIIDLLPDSIYAKDRDRRKTLANPVDVRFMGLSREADALGKTDAEIFPHDVAAHFSAVDEQVMHQGKELLNQEEWLVTMDGETRYLLTSKVPLRNASGEIVGLVGVGRDISELKQAQVALQELNHTLEQRIEERTRQLEREIEGRIRKERDLALSEQRLRQIIDLVPHMIFAKDIDGRYILANKACAASLGTTVEQLIGRRDSDFNPFCEDVSRYVAEDRAVIKSGDVLLLPEERVHFADGSLHILQTIKIPFTAAGNDLPAVLGVGIEITEQKQAEWALQRTAEEVSDLYNNAPFGYHSLDTDGVITRMNDTELAWLGYDRELLLGHHYFVDLFAPASRLQLEAALDDLTAAEQIGEVEADMLGRDGRVMPVSMRALAVFENGVFAGSRWTVVDDSERRQARSALQRSHDDLQAANSALREAARMKDEFMANMSHELRTPLTSVLGLAEALQLQTYGPLTERQERSLRIIEHSGRELLSMINDILDLSRIGAGRLHLNITPFDAVTVGRHAVQQAQSLAAEKSQIVSFAAPVDALEMRGDQRRVLQILANLLSNATKFTPEGGQLGLQVEPAPDGSICFHVWDRGIGIADENLPQLFSAFTQLDGSRTRLYEGTGLGLALVKSLAELHGGSVAVESTPGAGSRFTVCLPSESKSSTEE